MIYLKSNANSIIRKLAFEDGVRAYYFSVCERYTNGYIQLFITDLQNLITKLGIMVSKASTSERNISYCTQSISYLCNTVLDNASLENTFDSLGINDKGNKGKHDIVTNKIDMDRCVSTYNNLVNTISAKYNLPALKDMVVSKRSKNNNQSKAPQNKAPQKPVRTTTPSKARPKTPSHPNETATTEDEKLRVNAELCRGDGRYQKGIFHKTAMVNFVLKVNIQNRNDLKISSVTALFKCGKNTYEKKISTDLRSSTEIDLETDKFSGNIEASVVVIYKLGLFKSKKIKVTVSKNF